MDDKDLISCIVDIAAKLGHIDGVLIAHYKALDNLVTNQLDKTEAIKALQKQICDIQDTIGILGKELHQFVLQNDLAEKQFARECKQSKQLAQELHTHKFNWSKFFKATTKFITDVKFIATVITLLVGLLLVWSKAINLQTLWDSITSIFK